MKNRLSVFTIILMSLCSQHLMAENLSESKSGNIDGVCFFEAKIPPSGRISDMKLIPTFQDIEKCGRRPLDLPIPFVLETTPAPCRVQPAPGDHVRLTVDKDALGKSQSDMIMEAYSSRCAAK